LPPKKALSLPFFAPQHKKWQGNEKSTLLPQAKTA
jgi:hypothetical protein